MVYTLSVLDTDFPSSEPYGIGPERKTSMFTIREIYALAVQIEKNGEAFYRDAVKKVPSPSLQALFERLAEEEVSHRETFQHKEAALSSSEPNVSGHGEIGTPILQELLGDQAFSLKEVDLSTLKKQEDLIAAALEFERDTILFYDMISAFIEDAQTLARIREIKEEESQHIALLEAYDPQAGRY
jgi:rubrerythrin